MKQSYLWSILGLIVVVCTGALVRSTRTHSTLPSSGSPSSLDRAATDDRESSPAEIRPSRPASSHLDWVLNELARGTDEPTAQPFVLGRDGWLSSAPTRRVALLDELGRLDPKGAAAFSRTVLETFGSADEWAICLRNIARVESGPEVERLLREKVLAMWAHEPWRRNPSTGFLESFDVAVHLGGTELVRPLASLLTQTDNQAISHAAYLALDRLVVEQAGPVLALLQSEPRLLAGREVTLGNLFSRAGFSETGPRKLLEDYLLDTRRSVAELDAFAGLFPLASYDLKPGLLTRSAVPTHAQRTAEDRLALALVGDWNADSRFARLKPILRRLESRLHNFGTPPSP